MNILVAEDSPTTRHILKSLLTKWGYEVETAEDGRQAWEMLCNGKQQPDMIILDCVMPGMDGWELCRRIRESTKLNSIYIILCTAKNCREDIIKGFESGADDYIVKPFDAQELQVRVKAGYRIVTLKMSLEKQVYELQEALDEIKALRGILPICMYCKKIRDDGNYWHQLETYISKHSQAEFSHGMCPECAKKYFPDLMED